MVAVYDWSSVASTAVAASLEFSCKIMYSLELKPNLIMSCVIVGGGGSGWLTFSNPLEQSSKRQTDRETGLLYIYNIQYTRCDDRVRKVIYNHECL